MSESEERTGLEPRPVPQTASGIEEEEPPGKPRRHPLWRDVPDHHWNDWRWQSQNAIRSVRQLRDLLPFTPEELEAIGSLEAEYKLAIPPYYFSLIDPDDPNDPIRLQSVPSPLEMPNPSGYELEDPLEEDKDSPVPGLTHRYPDRALLVTTHVCTMYCRFCTRKRATMVRGGWDAISRNDERMIEYVRDHPEIRDVIVSGGDPLTLPLDQAAFFLDNLAAIPHVDVIRIGTRVPVTLPQKLYDHELIDLLAVGGEGLDSDALQPSARDHAGGGPRLQGACSRAGMPVNNHTVLLKGVNDALETMRDADARPAAHQGPPLLPVPLRPGHRGRPLPHLGVEGAGDHGRAARPHVRPGHSDLRRGQPARRRQDPADAQLPRLGLRRRRRPAELRRHAGPLPGGGQTEHGAADRDARRQSSLLQGTKSALIPENSERMARRKLHV